MELGDDAPPEEIWLDTEALEEHFDRVKARWSGGGDSGSWQPIDDGESVQNELTRGLRG